MFAIVSVSALGPFVDYLENQAQLVISFGFYVLFDNPKGSRASKYWAL